MQMNSSTEYVMATCNIIIIIINYVTFVNNQLTNIAKYPEAILTPNNATTPTENVIFNTVENKNYVFLHLLYKPLILGKILLFCSLLLNMSIASIPMPRMMTPIQAKMNFVLVSKIQLLNKRITHVCLLFPLV